MKITILGASGHGKVVAEIARLCGYTEIEFLDDDETKVSCGRYPVVGKCKEVVPIDNDIFIAIGDNEIRRRFIRGHYDKRIVSLIHPSAVVSDDVVIGKGSVVMAGSVINPGTKIGVGCIVNTCSSVDHDCKVGDYVHIAVGAHICGTVNVGENVWIGAGAILSNNVSICDDTFIGAGAVVTKDIYESGTYIGVPAKKMNKIED